MLYHLYDWLQANDVPGWRLAQYVTFRAGVSFILALIFSTIIGRRIIHWLHRMQIGEVVRTLGLEGEAMKKGTPTMGGIIIIIAIIVPTLLLARLDNVYIQLMLFTTITMGALGFIDDYIKVFKKNKAGLHGRYKIIGQVLLGVVVALTFYLSPEIIIRENQEVINNGRIEQVTFASQAAKNTQTTIPFVKNNNFDYLSLIPSSTPNRELVGWIVFSIIIILIVTFISNCVNLTDGLDGLAAGTAAPVGVALAVLAYVSSHIALAQYFSIMFIPGAEELVIFGAAFVGALFGFLWYNAYPAQVFMGDTGSLAIGSIIAVMAILIRKELLLPILCFLFIIEGLSSLIQQAYFKITKRRMGTGRRVFKMSPLHHHFQKAGNSGIDALIQRPLAPIREAKITVRFWLIAILLAVLTVITLKMR